MKILSIDVGIKNLAFCLLSNDDNIENYVIGEWNVINLAEKTENKCAILEKGAACNKPIKYTKDGKCYCSKHAKKCEFIMPSADFKPASLNKQKILGLMDLAAKYKITIEQNSKKADIINKLTEFAFNNCFQEIEKQNTSKVDLVTIGRNIQHRFDELLGKHLETINTVIIENQIGPIANKMKTLQGMISQYFIMRNNNIHIEFVNAGNKLKDFIGTDCKTDYKQRKQIGIQTCAELVSGDFKYQEWNSFFSSHQKKDDLADSFLQGLWFTKHRL
jgi:hypothetical protein